MRIMREIKKNRDYIYTFVRVCYATYEELDKMGERHPAVIESHATFEAAKDAADAYEQEYADKGIHNFHFCVKINTFYKD